MILWLDDQGSISYEKFLKDVNSVHFKSNSPYAFFVNLVRKLLKENRVQSITELTEYLVTCNESFDILTSGTTSSRKRIVVNFQICIRHVKIDSKGVSKVWGMGYTSSTFASTQVFFQALMNKEKIVYLPSFTFGQLSSVINEQSVTNLSCTPTFLGMLMMNMKMQCSSLRQVTTGGEKLTEPISRAMQQVFPNVKYRNIYATSETGSLLASETDIFEIPPRLKNYIKIVNSEIWVHRHLLNQIDLIEKGLWYNTNDKVELIDDRRFKIISRSNGYINTGGYRVSPQRVEAAFYQLDGIIDVHIYGKKNSILGAVICAEVIGKKLPMIQIKKELSNHLDKHEIPVSIIYVDSFTRLNNGKKVLMI